MFGAPVFIDTGAPMAAYITTVDINAAVTSAVRVALFSDDIADAFQDDLIEKASALVKSAAHRAGYTELGDTTTSQDVKTATLGQFLAVAYNRKQQELPAAFYESFNMLERIRTGQLPLTDLAVDTGSAYAGGAKFSETDSSVTGARYNPFGREKLGCY